MDPSTPMPVAPAIPSNGQWKAYLDRHPELASDVAVLTLTRPIWATIGRINDAVNAGRWTADIGDSWGHDLPGDCENFALRKRKRLAEAGLPLGALRICVGQITRRGRTEQHAVLHAVTDRGDYVLDNLTDDLLSWDRGRLSPLYRTADWRNYQPYRPAEPPT